MPDSVDRFRAGHARGGAAGLGAAIAGAGGLAQTAQRQFEAFANALADPALRKAAGEVLALEDATRSLNAQTRERLSLEARRQSVVSGSYQRELQSLKTLTRERERV